MEQKSPLLSSLGYFLSQAAPSSFSNPRARQEKVRVAAFGRLSQALGSLGLTKDWFLPTKAFNGWGFQSI